MHYLNSSRRLSFYAAMLLMVMGATATAQNDFNLASLNPGEILVNLTANEQTQVEQDTFHAQLNYIAQGLDRVALQDEVNQVMAEALELLTGSGIEYATQSYQVYPAQAGIPRRGGADITSWRAQQGVSLTSQDSAVVLDLVAELQELGLTMGGQYYSLSPERQEEVADSLMDAALSKVRNRAQAAATAMGKRETEIIEITMNSSNNGFFGGRAAMAMSSATMDVATPVSEPGLTTVMFNVSARVILIP